MERWHRQFIRFLFPYSASRMSIEQAFLVKHPHVPAHLYKYRQFKQSHMDALERSVLYMSSPDKFNDPFDTTIFFDTARFLVEDLRVPEFIAQLDRVVNSDVPWRPNKLRNPVRQGDWIRRMMTDVLKDESAQARDAVITAAENWLRTQSFKLRQSMRERFRSGFSVLSLSANPNSILMWSHYSDSHGGFCIEYDFESLLCDDLRRRLCFPVLYRGKKTDATRYMADTGATAFNNLFGQYLCLLKNSAWAYECEWRIVHAIGPTHANRELIMPKPSAIILGSAAKPDDASTLEEFCKAKDIPLKRAIPSDSAIEIIIR